MGRHVSVVDYWGKEASRSRVQETPELWLYEASDVPLIQEQTGACPTSSPGPTPCLICAPFTLENKNCDGFPREGEEM